MKKLLLLLTATICYYFSYTQDLPVVDQFASYYAKSEIFEGPIEKSGSVRLSNNWLRQYQAHNPELIIATGVPIKLGSGIRTEIEQIASEILAVNLKGAQLAITANQKYNTYKFQQIVNGIPVKYGVLNFRLTKEKNLVEINGNWYRNIPDNFPNAKTTITPVISNTNLVGDGINYWLPTHNNGVIYYMPVKEVKRITKDGLGFYMEHYHAQDLELIQRINLATSVADIDISGNVVDNALQPASIQNLPYLRTELNSTNFFADQNGQISLPITSAEDVTFHLDGLYCNIVSGQSQVHLFDVQQVNTGNASFSANVFPESAVSAYYHITAMHDFMKQHTPAAFTALDNPMLVRTDFSSGSLQQCNASYNPGLNRITLLNEGDDCFNMALFNDIIYHEYGHGITFKLYDFFGGTHNNGAIAEGYADVWAIALNQNRSIAEGYLKANSNSFIREYNSGPKVYPEDIIGEVHADGEIIAGAFIELLDQLNDFDLWMSLFVNSQSQTRDQPNGQEGILFRQILLDVLFEDDNDGDITNGTPNDVAIINSFAKHGITLFNSEEILHNEIEITAALEKANPRFELKTTFSNANDLIEQATVFYKQHTNSSYTPINVANPGINFATEIPAQPVGTIVNYYVEIEDKFGNVIQYPKNIAIGNLPLSYVVGMEVIEINDFDENTGNWEVNLENNDTATTGQWIEGNPNPSYVFSSQGNLNGNNIVQTADDYSENGVNCAFTGNAPSTQPPGTNDVDNGSTSIYSPVFNLSNEQGPVIEYYRWFTNEKGSNPGSGIWQVDIRNNNGPWQNVELTTTPDKSWRKQMLKVSDYNSETAAVQLRFIATDNDGALVEAALDDLTLYSSGLESAAETKVVVFPTLNNGTFTVNTRGQNEKAQRIDVYSLAGKLMVSEQLTSNQFSNRITLPQNTVNGLYIISFSFPSGATIEEKIVINR